MNKFILILFLASLVSNANAIEAKYEKVMVGQAFKGIAGLKENETIESKMDISVGVASTAYATKFATKSKTITIVPKGVR